MSAPPVDPFSLFAKWMSEAEASEINDPNAMALATADAQGRPSVRMVLLKDAGPAGFVFYTNLESRKGGELAANLDALYDYIGRQLLQANLRNDAAKLDEAVALLCGLRESWEQVDPARAAAPAPRPDRAAAVSYGQA